MAKFQGTMWLANQVTTKLPVDVDIRDEGTVIVTARDMTIGEWSRSDLVIEPLNDGVHIIAEGEELVFSTTTPGFVSAIAGLRPRPGLAGAIAAQTAPAPLELEPERPLNNAAPVPTQPHKPRVRSRRSARASRPARAKRTRTVAEPGLVLAACSLIIGLLAAGVSFVPGMGVAAIAAGVLAAVLGIVAGRGMEWWEAVRVKSLSTAGIALGIVALSLGVMRFDDVNSALNSAANEIGNIVDGVEQGGSTGTVNIQVIECSSNGASGTVTNEGSAPVDVLINAVFYGEDGVQVASGTATIDEIGPGQSQPWQVATGGVDYAHCQAVIQHASPS